ncbi:MAG: signal peptidase II [Lachnospiraceae bacterium]|nr:signal peptidase II [Lachnospiraceae bacterium]
MIYVILAAVIFAGEYLLKNKMDAKGEEGPKKTLLHGKITLWKYHNHGAFRNLGEKRGILVPILSVVLSLALTIVFVISLGTKGTPLLRAGLTLLLGGAYSNTYDRLKRKYVVDYFSIKCKNKWINELVFNVSDFCIMIGALVACLAVK